MLPPCLNSPLLFLPLFFFVVIPCPWLSIQSSKDDGRFTSTLSCTSFWSTSGSSKSRAVFIIALENREKEREKKEGYQMGLEKCDEKRHACHRFSALDVLFLKRVAPFLMMSPQLRIASSICSCISSVSSSVHPKWAQTNGQRCNILYYTLYYILYINKSCCYKCDDNERMRWIYLVAEPAHPVHWAECLSSPPGRVCTAQSALPCLFWGWSGPWGCGISAWASDVMNKERKAWEEWDEWPECKRSGDHTCRWWRLAACCFRVAMIVLTALYSLLSSINQREDEGEGWGRWSTSVSKWKMKVSWCLENQQLF